MLSPGNYIFNTYQRSSVSPLSDMDYSCFTILLRNSLTFCTDTINRKDSASEESKRNHSRGAKHSVFFVEKPLLDHHNILD